MVTVRAAGRSALELLGCQGSSSGACPPGGQSAGAVRVAGSSGAGWHFAQVMSPSVPAGEHSDRGSNTRLRDIKRLAQSHTASESRWGLKPQFCRLPRSC